HEKGPLRRAFLLRIASTFPLVVFGLDPETRKDSTPLEEACPSHPLAALRIVGSRPTMTTERLEDVTSGKSGDDQIAPPTPSAVPGPTRDPAARAPAPADSR